MRPESIRWFEQAKEELDTARVSLEGQKWFACAFWAQQCVEKALFIEKKRNQQEQLIR